MANRIELEMPNGNKLVAEIGGDSNYKEIFIGLEDKDGIWFQDLAVVGEKYIYNEAGEKETVDGEYRLLIYGDEYDEDYTQQLTIKEYKEEEEA